MNRPHAPLPRQLTAAAAIGLAVGAAGCTIYDCPTVYEPRAVVVSEAPPPVWERVAEAPEKPAAGATWVEGHWDWQGRWVWVEGHWETRPAGQTWTEPRVVRVQDGYEYHPGYWRDAQVDPSPVYRQPGDVRVSARFEARAEARVGGDGTRRVQAEDAAPADDDRDVRVQEGDNRTVRGGDGDEPAPRGGASDQIRATTGATSGGAAGGAGTGTTGGRPPARPATGAGATGAGATSTVSGSQVRAATGDDRRVSGEQVTRAEGDRVSSDQVRPATGATRGPDTVTGGGGTPSNTRPDTGARGPETVNDARDRPSDVGPGAPATGVPGVDRGASLDLGELTCEPEGRTVLARGYTNIRFSQPLGARPIITIGRMGAPVVAQQNDFQRVRVLVPDLLSGGTVTAELGDGRILRCGTVTVLRN